MSRLSRLFRTLTIILAAAQYALAGASIVGDGMEADAGKTAVSHIESHTSHCPRVHNDDCVVCQFIAHNGATPTRGASGLLIADGPKSDLLAPDAKIVVVAVYTPLLPRAPPVS